MGDKAEKTIDMKYDPATKKYVMTGVPDNMGLQSGEVGEYGMNLFGNVKIAPTVIGGAGALIGVELLDSVLGGVSLPFLSGLAPNMQRAAIKLLGAWGVNKFVKRGGAASQFATQLLLFEAAREIVDFGQLLGGILPGGAGLAGARGGPVSLVASGAPPALAPASAFVAGTTPMSRAGLTNV